ncbi:MAG TPA: hypothetical protein VNY05_35215 [Candidatus Acidoferrales bacterium]|jgi:hypothetical protein|nr:hypothetical protein [Candidatus Acidoferrales bacterium]
MLKSKLSAFLSLLLVFLSGALVGAFAYRLVAVNTVLTSGANSARPARLDPEEVRKHLDAEMRDRVKLDDGQIAKYNKILDETHDEFDQIHKKANDEARALRESQHEKVNAILREDQKPLYAQLRAEKAERERKRHQNEKQDFKK